MEKSTENTAGILNIIDLLSDKFKDNNVEYVEHYLTDRGTYKVFLSDGSAIEIHRTTAMDAEDSMESITEESLSHIINFRKTI